MPVSKHKRKGKVKGQTGKGKAAQFRAINGRMKSETDNEIMGMMADMIHASDRRKSNAKV